MSRAISAEGLRELFAQESGHLMLALLTIPHATLPEPIRLVNDRAALEYEGHTYQPLPFELTLPADLEDQIPHIELRIDNIGRALVELLRSQLEPVEVVVDLVRVAPPAIGSTAREVVREMGPLDFSLLDVQIGPAVITARLGYVIDILNTAATQHIMNPSLAPGLFR